MHGHIETAASHVVFGWDALWVATTLFVLTYAAIISERVNRAIVALLAAGLMIVSGVLNQQAAVQGIDFNTIALLTGMMVLVAVTRRSGIFQYVAIWSTKKVKANPRALMWVLAIVTAVFSALLDNVTTVLLIVPVTLLITEELKLNPYPFLLAEIFASNIGGTATLIGDPPNILIGSATHLNFNDFLMNTAPAALLAFIVTFILIDLIWGRKLVAYDKDRERVMRFKEKEAIKDPRLLKQALGVIFLVLFGFVFAHEVHLEPGTIAMLGAALLLLLDNWPRNAEEQSHEVHHAFGEVEWVTIFFFIGLFVVVHGVERAGLLAILSEKVLSLTGGDLPTTGYVILWSSAVLSAIVDNIPFVATMIPLIKSMAPQFGGAEAIEPLWWALSLGACLGGNGSLIGASANLTVAGFAERAGHPIRFMKFMKMAFPLMLVSIAIAHFYISWRYF